MSDTNVDDARKAQDEIFKIVDHLADKDPDAMAKIVAVGFTGVIDALLHVGEQIENHTEWLASQKLEDDSSGPRKGDPWLHNDQSRIGGRFLRRLR